MHQHILNDVACWMDLQMSYFIGLCKQNTTRTKWQLIPECCLSDIFFRRKRIIQIPCSIVTNTVEGKSNYNQTTPSRMHMQNLAYQSKTKNIFLFVDSPKIQDKDLYPKTKLTAEEIVLLRPVRHALLFFVGLAPIIKANSPSVFW